MPDEKAQPLCNTMKRPPSIAVTLGMIEAGREVLAHSPELDAEGLVEAMYKAMAAAARRGRNQ